MVENHYRWDFIGLSTDVKPTPETSEKVTDGSTFYCSDTSKLYVFCEGEWYEKVAQGGGGGGTNDFNQLINLPKYDSVTMSGNTNIPKVPTATSELTNDSGFITSSALPTVNDATLTITQNGTSKGTFTANDADDTTIALTDTTYNAGSGLDLTGTEFSVDTTTIQPKLTAGSNVTIDANNEISATDTTYSNFVGTDGTAAGTAGLVPAPATTDAGKFLKADGTWDTAGGGGPTVVQTTGTSTTDVMSQNAVTSMIYKDPENKTRIVIGKNAASYTTDTISIGTNSYVDFDGSMAVGKGAEARQEAAVALGAAAKVHNSGGIAIGREATASGNGSISLGARSRATVQGQFDVSTTTTAWGYNNSNYRLLTGLYDGQSAHDAVTVGQITPLSDSSAPTTATVGRLGQIFIDTTNADAYMCVAVDSVTPSYTWKKISV